MEKILFREAAREDLETIVAMLADDPLGQTREILQDELATEYIDAFNAIMEDKNQLLAIAEDAGHVVGCLQLSVIPGLSRSGMWRGQIESVRVSANYRGKGVGQAFIKWAVEVARSRGCGLVQLTSDLSRPEAISFYESLGFKHSHAGLKLDLK